MTPTAEGPPRCLTPASPWAAAASASSQETSTSSSPRRTRGWVTRSSLLTASKSKRPLSHSHVWFTGSESTPRYRVSRLEDDCTTTRQPTAHEGVVDEEELEHPVLGLLHLVGGRAHLLAVGHGDEAGGLEGVAARPPDLHEAHAAHAHRLHPGVVAEPRDVGARPLRGRDDH